MVGGLLPLSHCCVAIERRVPFIFSELVHFTTSSTGRIVTVDRRLGIVLWELDLQSPVIAVYIVEEDGLLTVPFTSVADETLDRLLKRFASQPSDIQLSLVTRSPLRATVVVPLCPNETPSQHSCCLSVCL